MIATLKIDYDLPLDAAGVELLERRIELVSDVLSIPITLSQIWRTRRGVHVVALARAPRITPHDIVTIQLLLGSDWKREMFNFARVLILADAPAFWRSDDRWNVLYSEKMTGEP